MSVFDKARELSNLIIETDEYKNLEKARVAFEHNSMTKEEFIKIKKTYDNYLEQIFSLIRMNVCDEETIETNENDSKCSSCSGCKGCSKK
jgi:hypothetical protein